MILLTTLPNAITGENPQSILDFSQTHWPSLMEANNVQELVLFIEKSFESSLLQIRYETELEKQLERYWQLPVEVMVIRNSSNFKDLILQVDEKLHWLAMHEPFKEVGFYSPSMTLLEQALIVEGVRTFEDRFHSLYRQLSQNYAESPLQGSWLSLFKELLFEYDYKSAKEMMTEAKLPGASHIEALIDMQYARLNFNFAEARSYAKSVPVEKNLTLFHTHMILDMLTSDESQHQLIAQITELYRHIEIMLKKEDWSSFLTRFYRAREALLLLIYKYGMPGAPDLRMSNIYELIDVIEEGYLEGEITHFYGAYFYTKSSNVAQTLNARNKSFIGHTRSPIKPKQMFEDYYGIKNKSTQMPERFLADSKIMLKELGSALDDNMASINQLIIKLTEQYLEEAVL